MQVEVTTWYLEMLHPEQLRPTPPGEYDLRIEQVRIPSPEFSRFLYATVGKDWYWRDRLSWTEQQWMEYLDRPQVQTWVAYIAGAPAGYVELEAQPEQNVEIAYFGILPAFMGKRLGGHLLGVGVQQAWAMGAKRVWVHTCSLDSPYALKNYQARGFEIYNTETRMQDLAPQSS